MTKSGDGEDTAALVALAGLPGIGPAALMACHRGPGGTAALAVVRRGRTEEVRSLVRPARLVDGGLAALVAAARAVDPARVLARHRRRGIEVLVEGQLGFPARLAADPSPPAVLFARGDRSRLDRPTVAIVGTRNATGVGRELARELGTELGQAGVVVVSGLAKGIDAAAHRGALGAAGSVGAAPVVGVVAAGLDITYPTVNAGLHRDVAARGLLLAEVPLGTPPVQWRFPARNRMIAGLADALVVVESRLVGGSMSTVTEALGRGIPVLAVPGHPRAPASAGTNQLLFEGAGLVRSAADVFGALGIDPASARPAEPPPPEIAPDGSSSAEDGATGAVLAAVGWHAASLGEVVARSGLSLEAAAAALEGLEAGGAVRRTGTWFERVTDGRNTDDRHPAKSRDHAARRFGSLQPWSGISTGSARH